MRTSLSSTHPTTGTGRRPRDRIGVAVGLTLFVLALVALHGAVRGFSLHDFARQASSLSVWQVVIALALTGLSYLTLTSYDILALRHIRHPLPFRRIALASFIGYAFSNTIGLAFLSGGSVRYRLYSSWGLTPGQIAKVVAFCAFTFFFGAVAIAGVICSIQPVPAFGLPPEGVRLLGLLMVGATGVFLGLSAADRPLALFGRNWRLPSLKVSLLQIGICGVDLVLTGGVLYALLPAAVDVAFLPFIGAFLLSNALGHLSQVPGGLGVFETTMFLLLSAHVPPSALLSSLLLFRVTYHLLPLLAAVLLLGLHEATRERGAFHRLLDLAGEWPRTLLPDLLALTAFAGGAVLLFTGAVPAPPAQMAFLRSIVPLPVIEIAHLAGSLAGLALLLAAPALERRSAKAFRVAVWALTVGMVCVVLRSLAVTQAVILGILLLPLLPSRGLFKAHPLKPAAGAGLRWTAMTLLAAGLTVFLTALIFKRVRFAVWLLWSVHPTLDSARSLRATALVVLVLLVVGLLRTARGRRLRGLSG